MAGFVSIESQEHFLETLKTTFFDGCELRLFKSDTTPGANTILTDFVEVADGTEYTAEVLSTWDGPTLDADNDHIFIDHSPVTFPLAIPSGTYTVYGFYLVGGIGGTEKLLFAQRFASPLVVDSADYEIEVEPRFDMADFYHTA